MAICTGRGAALHLSVAVQLSREPRLSRSRVAGLPDSMDLVDLGQWRTVLSSLTAASNLAYDDLGTERTWCVTCIASTGPGGSR